MYGDIVKAMINTPTCNNR